MSLYIFRSVSERVMPLRAITRSAMAKKFRRFTSLNPALLPPSIKDATKLRGKPLPWMFTPTPSTVAVLIIQLTPVLQWSPITSPTNCLPVRSNRCEA